MDLKSMRGPCDDNFGENDNNNNDNNKNNKSLVGNVRGAATLLLLAVNVTLVLVAAVVLIAASLLARRGDLCLSEQCIHTASSVLKAMDNTADPCKDFYQYACGRWTKNNPVPEWTATWDRLSVLRESLLLEMRRLLETSPHTDVHQHEAVRKARLLYKTCMNTEELERLGMAPIKRTLEAVGLPTDVPGISGNSSESEFNFVMTIARCRRLLGINILYSFNVAEDVRNSSIYRIVIEQVSPGFGEKFLLQPEKFSHEIRSFKKHIVKMLESYTNSSKNTTYFTAFAEDVITVATTIAQVMTPIQERRSAGHLFHEVSLLELDRGPGHEKWRTINWTEYLHIVFNDSDILLDAQSDRVILLDLTYMKKMATILDSMDEIMLEKFIWWNVFTALAPLTMGSFRALNFELSQQLVGISARAPRWKGCTHNVNSNFGLALSYEYVRSRLTQHDKDNVLQMLDDVRAAFEEAVHQLDWMDTSTREKTLTKLYAIRAFVGYPGWIMNSTQLAKYYEKAHVLEDNLFDTFLNLTNAAVKRNLGNLRKKPNRNRWVATATTVNAFYSATLNSVTFPAGILKPPFYGNGIEAIDYGAIGAIMGHEVTHGFDDQGRRYDEHGNLKQWWSPATLEHYHGRVQCIIDQYNNYTMPELGAAFSVQGVNTQGENIADNGGLRAAYVGYRRRQAIAGTMHQRLPGLPHITNDQLFFLGFAQIWCGNSTLGALRSKLVDGVHSPNRVRVLGTLSNSQEFATAWNCPSGTPMNPQHKCVLW